MADGNSTNNDPFKLLLLPLSIILSGLMVMFGVLLGTKAFLQRDEFVTKKMLKDEISSVLKNYQGAGAVQEDAAPKKTSTNIDDDPILGDRSKAKVAIVEYSDYECPFCKKYFDETYEQVKKEYVDTGKAIIVFRDYPLSFHDPLASYEASAANCVREQGGDSKYYQFHDLLFKNTKSNGNGLTNDQVINFANEVGVNRDQVKQCVDSNKYKDEIKKDMEDGTKAGVSGTPGFIVGKLDDKGNVDGVVIEGAQPFASFKSALEEQLAR